MATNQKCLNSNPIEGWSGILGRFPFDYDKEYDAALPALDVLGRGGLM